MSKKQLFSEFYLFYVFFVYDFDNNKNEPKILQNITKNQILFVIYDI